MLSYRLNINKIALMLFLTILTAFSQKICALRWMSPPTVLSAYEETEVFLASNPRGDSFTLTSSEFFDTEIAVARFSDYTESYEPPTVLSIGSAIYAAVAADASNTALFIWSDYQSGLLQTAFYNGTSYITPSPNPLYTLEELQETPVAIAMDGKGNGLAVWGDPLSSNSIASFFSSTTQSWETPTQLNVLPCQVFNPVAGYSFNGTAVAAWQDSEFNSNIFVSIYNGSSWGAPFLIASGAESLKGGIDANGTAVLTWLDNNTLNVYAAQYTGAWSVSAPITFEQLFNGYEFSMSSGGHAIVAWVVGDSTSGKYTIYNGSVWSAPAVLGPTFNIYSSMDSVNNTLIVYQDFPSFDIYSLKIPADGVPSASDFVANLNDLFPAESALSDNGRGFVSGFGENISEGQLPVSTYTELLIDGAACYDTNRIAQRVHVVFFSASSNPNIVAYNIRRNGVLIDTQLHTGAENFTCYDYNRDITVADIYMVTYVDARGNETNPLFVVLQ